MKNTKTLKLSVLSLMIALGVVISPILRVEGMCPMAHFINIVCSVLLGPGYSLLCATIIGVLRMIFMGIPPIALTGAVFGAYLSGVLYRASKGKLLFAFLGEVIGTGLIGSVLSYPVMTYIWGRTDLNWLFYVPSFVLGTLIGGFIAYGFLKKLSKHGILQTFQKKLSSNVYDERESALENSLLVASIGVLIYVAVGIFKNFINSEWAVLTYISKVSVILFTVLAIINYFVNKGAQNEE